MRGLIYSIEKLKRDQFSLMESSIQVASDSTRALPDISRTNWECSTMSMELCNSFRASTKCLLLVAEKSMEVDNSAGSVTFSLVVGGDWWLKCVKTSWVSNPCSFMTGESMKKKCLPLLLQLIREIEERAPKLGSKSFSSNESIFIDPILIESLESFKEACNLAFLSRLFWLCAFEVPEMTHCTWTFMTGESMEKKCLPLLLQVIGEVVEQTRKQIVK
jgi:hypothetical protein